jgi:hypothetical protein
LGKTRAVYNFYGWFLRGVKGERDGSISDDLDTLLLLFSTM